MGQALTQRLGRSAAVVGRLLAAGPAMLLMGVVVIGAANGVSAYAVRFCGWPASLSCGHGSTIWELVPFGLGVGALVGTAALGEWVITSQEAWRAWAFPAWLAGFPFVVLFTGPKEFGPVTLVVVGGYAGLLIHLIRRLLTGVLPERVLQVAVVVAWAGYLPILLAVPDLLADAAVAEGLAPRP